MFGEYAQLHHEERSRKNAYLRVAEIINFYYNFLYDLRILFLYDRNAQLYCYYFDVFVFSPLYCLLNSLTFTEDDPMWAEMFEYF